MYSCTKVTFVIILYDPGNLSLYIIFTMSNKRARTEWDPWAYSTVKPLPVMGPINYRALGYKGGSGGSRKGYWARKRFSDLHPWSTHGATRVKRGSKFSLDHFGPSYKEATAAQKKRREKFGFTGRGMYYGGAGSYMTNMLGRQFNRTLAGQTPLGSAMRGVARSALDAAKRKAMSFIGQGSYAAANNLVSGGGLSVPTFSSTTDETGALVVQHEEFVKDIYGVHWDGSNLLEPFVSDSLSLNPGLSRNFPWLSQIACNYEEYEFLQLMFCFKSRVGENLTTSDGQVGTIMMFTDYNAADAKRTTKQSMLQAYGTSVARVTDQDVLHGIECDPSKIKGDAHKFIRTGVVEGQDVHDFDWGLFQIAVDNTPIGLSDKVIGELYVSYTVRLRKPRLYSTLGLAIQQDQFLVEFDDSTGAGVLAPVLATANNNSLGALLSVGTPVPTSTTANMKITLPSSFSGGVEVVLISDPSVGTSQHICKVVGFDGNVAPLEDLAKGDTHYGGTIDGTDPTSGAGPSGLNSNVSSSVNLGHFSVVMANQGQDNCINIQQYFATGSSARKLQTLVIVRRYNSNELITPPEFKKANGQILAIDSE